MSIEPNETELLIAFARAASKAQEIEALFRDSLIAVEVAMDSIDFFLRVPVTPANFTVNVTFGGTTVFSHLFTSNTNGYIEETVTATASGGNTTLSFANSGTGNGLFLFDDVSVEPTGVPGAGSTLPLLSFASLGLVALRRKLSC